jgi:hypothetical protein
MPKNQSRATTLNPNTVGRNESAFTEQYSAVADKKPALFEAGRTVAQDLDNPDLIGARPQLMRQYQSVCASLDATPKRSRGRLLQIQNMVNQPGRQAK